MLGVGGFPSSGPLQDHKRPLSFRGLLSATDPLLPDDVFMGNVSLLIAKLTYTVTWAPAAARPQPSFACCTESGRNKLISCRSKLR